jgi:hypothetical protein
VAYIQELQDAIRHLRGREVIHIESIPVRETFQGRTLWDGAVEVFEIKDHPDVNRIYAWSRETDSPNDPRRYVAVLNLPPVHSAQEAVRALIAMEFRNARRQGEEG